jgi:hypothetical protein
LKLWIQKLMNILAAYFPIIIIIIFNFYLWIKYLPFIRGNFTLVFCLNSWDSFKDDIFYCTYNFFHNCAKQQEKSYSFI